MNMYTTNDMRGLSQYINIKNLNVAFIFLSGESSRATPSSEHRQPFETRPRQTPEPTKIYQGSLAGTPITTASALTTSAPPDEAKPVTQHLPVQHEKPVAVTAAEKPSTVSSKFDAHAPTSKPSVPELKKDERTLPDIPELKPDEKLAEIESSLPVELPKLVPSKEPCKMEPIPESMTSSALNGMSPSPPLPAFHSSGISMGGSDISMVCDDISGEYTNNKNVSDYDDDDGSLVESSLVNESDTVIALLSEENNANPLLIDEHIYLPAEDMLNLTEPEVDMHGNNMLNSGILDQLPTNLSFRSSTDDINTVESVTDKHSYLDQFKVEYSQESELIACGFSDELENTADNAANIGNEKDSDETQLNDAETSSNVSVTVSENIDEFDIQNDREDLINDISQKLQENKISNALDTSIDYSDHYGSVNNIGENIQSSSEHINIDQISKTGGVLEQISGDIASSSSELCEANQVDENLQSDNTEISNLSSMQKTDVHYESSSSMSSGRHPSIEFEKSFNRHDEAINENIPTESSQSFILNKRENNDFSDDEDNVLVFSPNSNEIDDHHSTNGENFENNSELQAEFLHEPVSENEVSNENVKQSEIIIEDKTTDDASDSDHSSQEQFSIDDTVDTRNIVAEDEIDELENLSNTVLQNVNLEKIPSEIMNSESVEESQWEMNNYNPNKDTPHRIEDRDDLLDGGSAESDDLEEPIDQGTVNSIKNEPENLDSNKYQIEGNMNSTPSSVENSIYTKKESSLHEENEIQNVSQESNIDHNNDLLRELQEAEEKAESEVTSLGMSSMTDGEIESESIFTREDLSLDKPYVRKLSESSSSSKASVQEADESKISVNDEENSVVDFGHSSAFEEKFLGLNRTDSPEFIDNVNGSEQHLKEDQFEKKSENIGQQLESSENIDVYKTNQNTHQHDIFKDTTNVDDDDHIPPNQTPVDNTSAHDDAEEILSRSSSIAENYDFPDQTSEFFSHLVKEVQSNNCTEDNAPQATFGDQLNPLTSELDFSHDNFKNTISETFNGEEIKSEKLVYETPKITHSFHAIDSASSDWENNFGAPLNKSNEEYIVNNVTDKCENENEILTQDNFFNGNSKDGSNKHDGIPEQIVNASSLQTIESIRLPNLQSEVASGSIENEFDNQNIDLSELVNPHNENSSTDLSSLSETNLIESDITDSSNGIDKALEQTMDANFHDSEEENAYEASVDNTNTSHEKLESQSFVKVSRSHEIEDSPSFPEDSNTLMGQAFSSVDVSNRDNSSYNRDEVQAISGETSDISENTNLHDHNEVNPGENFNQHEDSSSEASFETNSKKFGHYDINGASNADYLENNDNESYIARNESPVQDDAEYTSCFMPEQKRVSPDSEFGSDQSHSSGQLTNKDISLTAGVQLDSDNDSDFLSGSNGDPPNYTESANNPFSPVKFDSNFSRLEQANISRASDLYGVDDSNLPEEIVSTGANSEHQFPEY